MMGAAHRVNTFLRSNSPALLSGVAVVGVFSTGILAFKAGQTVGYDQCANDNFSVELERTTKKQKAKYYFDRYWRDILPPVSAGALTVTAVVLSNRVGARRTAAATAAYALTEQTLGDYRDKVIERFGEKADGEIKAEVAQDKVKANQPKPDAIIIAGAGTQLCQESYTGRYFLSDMESLRRAQNDLNAQLIQHDCVTLSEWYHMIGLADTSYSHDSGWNADKIMELEFSAVITEDGRPCMVFDYNYVRPLFG